MSHGFYIFSKKNRLNQGGIIALAVLDTHPQAVSNRCYRKPLN